MPRAIPVTYNDHFERQLDVLSRDVAVNTEDQSSFWRKEDPILDPDSRQLIKGGFWDFQRRWWDSTSFVKVLVAGYGCIAGETLILDPTTGKEETAENLAANGLPIKVMSIMPDGTKKVCDATAPFVKGVTDLYRVTLEDGRSVLVTQQHKFLTPSGWKPLSSLGVGVQLKSEPCWLRISTIEFVRTDKFYDLTVPGPANYLAQGVWHHNSGKSFLLCKRAISSALENAPCPVAIVSPTLRMARRTVIRTMLDLLAGKQRLYGETSFWYRHNKSTQEIFIRYKGRTATIMFLSGDSPEHLKGSNLAAAYLDEPFIMEEEVFTQMIARVRHPDAKVLEIGLLGTPESGLGFGYKLCKGEKLESLAGIKSDLTIDVVNAATTENKTLDPMYVKRLLARLSPKAAEAYIEGKFVNLAEGRVFYAFDDEQNVMDMEKSEHAEYGAGIDFNVDPMCAIVFWRKGERVHVFDEIILENADTELLAQKLKKYRGLINVYPDPAGNQRKTSAPGGKTDFHYLREAGYEIYAPSRHYVMKDSLNIVNGRFRPADMSKKPTLTISPDCEKLIEALNNYSYRLASKQEHLKHVLDALRYPLAYLYPLPIDRAGTMDVYGA